MKYLITGGSGFIGSHLIPLLLEKGHEVINLSRKARSSDKPNLEHAVWDGKTISPNLGPVDVVINLAGANVGGSRWTNSYKQVILQSRIKSTEACVEFINAQDQKPSVFISSSGFNYYGDYFKGTKTEADGPGQGFLCEVCQKWEKAAEGAQGVRTVFLRTSVVLGEKDGPLAKMLTPFKMFVGGPLADGKQGFPWIHITDMVRAIQFCINHAEVSGPVNMVAPEKVKNEKFAKTLGDVLGRPSFFRLPKWLLQTIFGEMSVVLWGGGLVENGVLSEAGFTYEYPKLEAALEDLVG